MHITKLLLKGVIPAKKNMYRRGRGNSFFLPRCVAENLRSLELQAMIQWRPRPAVEHPDITMRFVLTSRRKDPNNLQQTILDVLQKAHVIVNDNVAKCNGRLVIEPSIVDPHGDESVEVIIHERDITGGRAGGRHRV